MKSIDVVADYFDITQSELRRSNRVLERRIGIDIRLSEDERVSIDDSGHFVIHHRSLPVDSIKQALEYHAIYEEIVNTELATAFEYNIIRDKAYVQIRSGSGTRMPLKDGAGLFFDALETYDPFQAVIEEIKDTQ
jgi:hypothetical protein